MGARKKTAADEWSPGARIGKLAQASLRELRMRTIIVGEWNHDVFIEIAEALEDLIDVVSEVSGEPHLVVEELGDAIKRIAECANEKVEEADEEIADSRREADEQRERVVGLEKDHDEDMRAVSENLDAMRARAEKAEHDLTESVRNGHGVDHDAEQRIRIVAESCERLRKEKDESWARERSSAEKARVATELMDRQAAKLRRLDDELVEARKVRDHDHLVKAITAMREEHASALTRVNALENELREAQEALGRIFAVRPTRKRRVK